MFFLAGDVALHGGELSISDGECAVSILPVEIAVYVALSLDPNGAVPFDIPDEFTQANVFARRRKQMNVIVGTSGGQELGLVIICNPTHVGEQTLFYFRLNDLGSMLC